VETSDKEKKDYEIAYNVILDKVIIHSVVATGGTVWLHTHGLNNLGLAELEIRDTPLVLVGPACLLINETAAYMLLAKNTDHPVHEGDTLQTGLTLIRFGKARPYMERDHYVDERWELKGILPRGWGCSDCRGVTQKPPTLPA
jgi:hypothetical protein